ncbi:MAG: hypothetical protein RB292_04855 [Patescibacteria group bacterium]|jgi:hypothetical protein|nr:hypothetical protein [Patescibacteria group bacterium]
MKKLTWLLSALALIAVVSGCSPKTELTGETNTQETNSECAQLCNQATAICPSLISLEQCQLACADWSEETKEKISQVTTCQELSAISEIIESLIPEMNDPKLNPAKNECEAACQNYVNQCLTLVPNATQTLFQEGLDSCLTECANWNDPMVKCMTQAPDCESMTNICGL